MSRNLLKILQVKGGKFFGPSTLVTAAFIGPGTLTVCTVAGARHGYSLLWVLLFALLATVILQEMAARLGLVTKQGLGEAIRKQIREPLARFMSLALVFTAIIVGNAAYEAGNIAGAVVGIEPLLGSSFPWSIAIGLTAFAVLYFGKYRLIERVLVLSVLVMSTVFFVTAVVVKPDLASVVSGLFVPTLNADNQVMALSLIGTTIVPYNLFLHASSISKKWKHSADLPAMRRENTLAIGIGGIISMSILITSAATMMGRPADRITDMAIQLQPLLGSWAPHFLSMGLFCAGISSTITAPLAAAFTAKGIFGWKNNTRSVKFRAVWMVVLIVGVVLSTLGYKPLQVIQIAQVANGILLPIVVIFLVYVCNKRKLLGGYANRPWQNAMAIFVVLVSVLISFRSFNSVWGLVG